MACPPVLLMDLGDTLMRVFPDQAGSIAAWPQVEAMPAARQALESLVSRYTLAVATGAMDSDAALVRQALDRVSLGAFFTQIYTSRDLGLSKADPAFYMKLLNAMDCNPNDVTMVGDGYDSDILAAQKAGLKAIWYNPLLKAVPTLPPEQNLEITNLADLPGALEHRALPDIPTCLAWQVEEGCESRVAAHSSSVATVAYLLAVWLRQAGEEVNPLLAHRGGLVHDLDKIQTLKMGNQHGKVTYKFLMAHHQPELAEIALRHNLSSILDPIHGLRTWEEKIVFYADKLVEGDRVVSLKDRFKALEGRYPGIILVIEASTPRVIQLESKICACLGKSPEILIDELAHIIN